MFKRDYSNFNENEFKEAIDRLDWESIVDVNQKDPNRSLNNIYNSITYLLDEFALMKNVTRKEYKLKFKPWITKEILQQCKETFSLNVSRKKTIQLRKTICMLPKNILEMLLLVTSVIARLYVFCNSLKKQRKIFGNLERNKIFSKYEIIRNNKINLLDKNNELINDQLLIANKFNDYFSTIGSVIKNKLPNTNGNNPLFLSPTNSSEIEKIINSLDANKSTGPNSIPVFILKILKPFFSFWLT